ncbi:MBL fold metallo-hydrolase [Paracoccus aerodenitrificans]|uniref:MBL fold metallo-hydrolase n=1 Tax=Paracoccus aerodenitrificans TaxID=3017781 RepID=UPI0022F11F76|nr:MBL fold metallo-hydrolase [Paracoccus aerodenitrificans]WBU64189.1 MBL fold metallo-hydrolase [Paracoccus aerodenitrificans]
MTRRLAAIMTGAMLTAAMPAHAGDFMVTLLGTASPAPRPDRSGPSILIEGGESRVLIDAGRNAPVRLWQAKIPIGSIDATVITHFHSDHTSGLADLWLTGWIARPFGGRDAPMRVIGPVGTAALTDGLQNAYDGDIQIRLVDEGNPPEGVEIETTEITEDGVVFNEGGLKVTMFATNHGENITPNYGIVAEYDGRKVVISGDTTYDERIAERGQGADLLIHELGTAQPELLQEDHAKRVIAHHTTPQQAGEIFAAAQPKLAAYTHLVMLSDANNPELTLPEIVEQTRETYGGPLVVGEDLMTFDIGTDGVATYIRD